MLAHVSFSAVSRSRFVVNEVTEELNKCHNMEPLDERNNHGDIDWRPWEYKVTGIIPSKLLKGPASLRKDQSIIYPCERGKCHIPCPCPICRDQQSGVSFQDHWVYHQAIHLKCEFCVELIRHIPAISFIRRLEISTSSRYSDTKDIVPITKTVYSWLFSHNTRFKTYKINPVYKGNECKECKKTFISASHRKRHFMAVHYKSKFECSNCKKLFSRVDELERHKRRKCNKLDVGKYAEDNSGIEEEASENSDSNYSNSDEGNKDGDKNVDNDDEQEEASETSDGDVNLSDNESASNLSDNDSKSKLPDKTFKCNLCRKTFTTKFNLIVHTRKRKHDCQLCNNTLCSKMALKIHVYNIHGRKIFHCPICKSEFTKGSNLKRHQLKCNLVKNISNTALLDVNQAGECSKQNDTDSEDNDKYHANLAEVGKALCCKMCDKRFSSFFNLGVHNSKPKKCCPGCQQKFCSNIQLSSHKSSVHGINSLQCPHCERAFTTKFNLKRHLISFH